MSKSAAATQARSGSRKGRPAAPGSGARRLRWPLIAAVAVIAVLVAAIIFVSRTADGQQGHDGSGGFGHVHGLAVDPGSGTLHVATHAGLYRIDDANTAVRVSKDAFDLMGFTVVGPRHFLASGHPDMHGDGPANLGLLESTDGGVTWRTMSLSGAADFHGLQAAHNMIYGYNSTDGAFMVSTDGRNWQSRSTVAMGSFVVSPADPDAVLAVGRAGLQRSTDGGRTWQAVPAAPPVAVLSWDAGPVVWGVAPDGTVWQSTDGGGRWQQRGNVPGQPQALATHDGTVFVATAGDRIAASTDGGMTWTPRYARN